MKEVHLNNQEASIDSMYSSTQLRDIHSLAVDIVLGSVSLLIKFVCYSLDCWNEFPVQLGLMVFCR